MADRNLITAERLREVLDYDPLTGHFTWLVAPNGRIAVGQRAGSIDNGYLRIKIDRRVYRASRLAFLYVTGTFPIAQADHENLDRSDNRWVNLRDANRSQNCLNQRARKNNTSGFKGVTIDKRTGKARAATMVNGKTKYLGQFDHPEDAHEAYRAACALYHGKFGRAD